MIVPAGGKEFITLDEKMKEALKSVYNNLTDGQKEKAKSCKTYEELMDFAGKEGIELPDDIAEAVLGAGGPGSYGFDPMYGHGHKKEEC